MFQSKKIAAAGLLGSLVLIGLGTVQAVGAESPGACTQNDKGHVRCVQESEYRVSEQDGKVRVDNKMSQSCSGKGELTCSSNLVLKGDKS
ncbi:hypothetical protein [Streptomyces pilosus]|uniref:Uncharacterized protein n=1 Tax=Streptomyces pilosus TaxID=28893 RepID=A0A918BF80_9ACTN|nr:hypothetical protein [Streptomyces pilosus]GGQ64640.1 hypothetical protein GCM10010280_08980 [Streptomyces pilosus]GGV34268.1 hypothetical protein GCM10010261_02740 [Streptomyces pilosus]